MSRIALLAAAALALAACSPKTGEAPAQPTPPADAPPTPTSAPAGDVLSAGGLGPIKVGMTEQEAWTAYGAADKPPAADPKACHLLSFPNLKGVQAMVEDGKISRLTLKEAGPLTDKGLGVGSTAEQVKAAYGAALTSEPHKYEPAPAAYLTAWATPGKAGVRYEIGKDGKVAAVHGGGPSILYVEGCS